jgi:4-amino-4-deoxy-L-arabinose transferase-like glycosyltransferase
LKAWAVAVFVAALAARLAFWWLADQPLLYAHQYHYFTNGLRIFEHPNPLGYLFYSDDWRTWAEHWTIAPLYYPFEALVFFLFGPHLAPLRLVQCVLGAVTAVAVGAMGREAAGPRGWLAGLAYAFYGYSVELPTWTLTENLHNALLAAACALLLQSVPRQDLRLTVVGGAILGLSALARSVSSAFLPVAALWRWWYGTEKGRVKAAVAVLVSGLALILPWSARNVLVIGDFVPIETTAYENIWYANHFTDPQRFHRQMQIIGEQPTPAAKRTTAMYFALRGIRRSPGAFIDKVGSNFWHFFRPEGLHNLLTIERTQEPWRHALYVVLEDGMIAVALPLFLVFLVGARRTAAWAFIALWTAYYLFFEVVVFLNEVPRHRAGFVPFFLAGAAGGAALMVDRQARRRWPVLVGLVLGVAFSLSLILPYVGPASRTCRAQSALRPAREAIARGDLAEADRLATAAALRAPRSPRPWFDHAQELYRAGHPAEALAAYDRGAGLATLFNWRADVARPRLLRGLGREADAATAYRKLDEMSWGGDPWLVEEAAWRELPPPAGHEVRLGDGDYGFVRDFHHPRGGDPSLLRNRLEWSHYDDPGKPQPPPGTHRWTRGRASVRIVPDDGAAAHELTLFMGAPFPSPLSAPTVEVRVNGGAPLRFPLSPEVKAYSSRIDTPPGEPVLVEIAAPTWCRAGEPADQGVRLDRVVLAPVP